MTACWSVANDVSHCATRTLIVFVQDYTKNAAVAAAAMQVIRAQVAQLVAPIGHVKTFNTSCQGSAASIDPGI